MYYLIVTEDKPKSLNLRLATRPSHIKYMSGGGHGLDLKIMLATALGQTMNGSLLIVQAESEQLAQQLMDNDPYTVAGLFRSIKITPINENFAATTFLKLCD